jgi:energy-coupling factor transport system substrate-specific component
MRELFTMWRDTRLIMLVGVTAAVYAAVLLPFKVFTILPGLTSVRPANVFPVVFGIMFGPAAAWGSAIGNLIGDVFGGTFGPGSVGGFLGNFFFGYVGYKMWGNLGPLSSGEEPDFRTKPLRQLVEYLIVTVAAATACAAIIAWVADALGLVPFAVLAPIIVTNNTVAAAVLGPPLLYVSYPRIKEMGLLYPDLLRDEDVTHATPSRSQVAAFGLFLVPLAWVALGTTMFGPSSTEQVALGAVLMAVFVAGAAMGGERLSSLVGPS